MYFLCIYLPFQPSDYKIVPVKSPKFNVRYQLDKNIVPHKNLPFVQGKKCN